MATRFVLPHIDISALYTSGGYLGSGFPSSSEPRIRAAHGAKLLREFDAALAAADTLRSSDDRVPSGEGAYVEVVLTAGTKPDILERKTTGLAPGAAKDEGGERTIALYVPDEAARAALRQILEDYRAGPLTEKGNPPQAQTVEAIDEFRQARLETLWTDDPTALPKLPQQEIWWAVWLDLTSELELEAVCERLDLMVAARDRRMYFPEMVVIPVLARRAEIELMTFATGIVAELRRASDNPVFYVDEARDEQHAWSDDLAGRVVWPGSEVPAICLLDTGVNRGHSLLEPALSVEDMHAVDEAWGVDDHHEFGHGTAMGGVALHGDLTGRLGDTAEVVLRHRLESVKLLPPGGGARNEPGSYGAITQAAVALPEITATERVRIYCLAVTNDGVSGAQPSTWSAAIDQAAAGTMTGEAGDSPESRRRRLFVVSTGNVIAEVDRDRLRVPEDCPAEDPSQAWNAITVGGYTELSEISEPGYEDWTPLATAGTLSPHSRTSVAWAQSRSPFKPELVFEAGNRAVSPSRREVHTLDSLSLLSTGHKAARPLVSFQATSAAAAQGARMAARLAAEHPEYWPETIRALMVHSAEWTRPMRAQLDEAEGRKREAYNFIRRYGYGVPDFDRAAHSAQDYLALVAQTEIQPFRMESGRRFNECHYYDLPWPTDVLEELYNEPVKLKVVLSYFVEPNPGGAANVDPQRYQSFGLRFDLRRRGETMSVFKQRVNASERDDPRNSPTAEADEGWTLGANSVSSGSLHCDIWTGPAVDLVSRDTLCIKPVNGWWRNRADRQVVDRKTRYSLVVTLRSKKTDVELHTAVQSVVDIRNELRTLVQTEITTKRDEE